MVSSDLYDDELLSFSSSSDEIEHDEEDSDEDPFLEEALPRVDVEAARREAGPLALDGVLLGEDFGPLISCSSFILKISSTSSLVTIPLAMASSDGISMPVSGSVIMIRILSTVESVVTSCLYMAAVSSLTRPLLTASSKVISSPVDGTSTMKDEILVVVTPLSMILALIVPPRTDRKSPSRGEDLLGELSFLVGFGAVLGGEGFLPVGDEPFNGLEAFCREGLFEPDG